MLKDEAAVQAHVERSLQSNSMNAPNGRDDEEDEDDEESHILNIPSYLTTVQPYHQLPPSEDEHS